MSGYARYNPETGGVVCSDLRIEEDLRRELERLKAERQELITENSALKDRLSVLEI